MRERELKTKRNEIDRVKHEMDLRTAAEVQKAFGPIGATTTRRSLGLQKVIANVLDEPNKSPELLLLVQLLIPHSRPRATCSSAEEEGRGGGRGEEIGYLLLRPHFDWARRKSCMISRAPPIEGIVVIARLRKHFYLRNKQKKTSKIEKLRYTCDGLSYRRR